MKKKLQKKTSDTTLKISPESEPAITSEDAAATTSGPAPCTLFIGVDGAARKAGVAFVVLSPEGDFIATLPVDTQSPNFFAELHAAVLYIAKSFPEINATVTTCEVPPPGRFAHKIGASVNFANGKILGTLGCYFAAAGLPYPVVHIPVMPNQWRKALIGGKVKGYDKSSSVKFIRKNVSKIIADTKTIDEVEALCVACYGIQQIYPIQDGVAQLFAESQKEQENV